MKQKIPICNRIEDTPYLISFLGPQSVPKIMTYLLSYEYIKRNVDDFFLLKQNYFLMSEYIRSHDAIAYTVNVHNDCLGCFFAFREEECLKGHFFFRIFPKLDTAYYTRQIILRMIRYFNKHSIRISKVIGQIPYWNLAAINVLKKIGARKQDSCVSNFMQNGTLCSCSEWIVDVPEYLHPHKLQCSKAKIDKHV